MNHVFNAALLAALLPSSAPLPTQSERARSDAVTATDTWSQEELERVSESIRLDIERLRGQAFERPVAVKLAGAEEFVRYVKQRTAKTETPESLAADETAAKLLGLIPSEMNLLETLMAVLEEQVGGFYDPDEDMFWLVETFRGDIARVILSHELTHALDDQLFDIDGTLERIGGDTDAELAYRSVVEGSGMYTMIDWITAQKGAIDMLAVAEAQDPGAGLEKVPPFIWKPLMSGYFQGLAFLKQGAQADEAGFLQRAFAQPPRSTEQVLHPELYWDPDRRDEPRRIAFDAPDPEAGWEMLAEDTLGELMLALVTTPADKRGGFHPLAVMSPTNAAAQGWGGDRMILLSKGDARLLRLVTVWDTEEDAVEFEEAARAAFEGLENGVWRGSVERSVTPGTHSITEGTAEHVVIDVRYGEAAREVEPPAWREVP
jgi:hypothetical protein